MRLRRVLIVWTAIALLVTGCGPQGRALRVGDPQAESEIGTGAPTGHEDDVRAALRRCWTIDPEMPPVVVELDVAMQPDGTVSSAVVSDQDRYRTDRSFRAAADRALRAVQNPHVNRCHFRLPPGRLGAISR